MQERSDFIMATSKFIKTNEAIAKKVTDAFEKTENAVVGGYG